jgi:hypothetical protein
MLLVVKYFISKAHANGRQHLICLFSLVISNIPVVWRWTNEGNFIQVFVVSQLKACVHAFSPLHA